MFLHVVTFLCFVKPFNFSGLSFLDPYQVLGLKKSFNQRDLRRVYRRYLIEKSRNVQPTVLRERQLREVEFSYNLLSNPSARKLYDQSTSLDFLNNADFTISGFASDIHMAVIQQTYGQVPIELAKSCGTIYFPVEFTLFDFYGGAKRRVYLSGLAKCVCKKGKKCRKCRDHPYTERIRTYTVVLPPGAPAYYPIFAQKVYDDGVDRAPHDIVFLPICADFPGFSRVGDDLWTNQTISLSEAIRGQEIEILSLDGAVAKVKLNASLQSGGVVRVPGKGFPIQGQEMSGDLVVQIDVAFPDELSPQQKEALRVLLPDDESSYE
jgi:DnaJ-class molecular chaperone